MAENWRVAVRTGDRPDATASEAAVVNCAEAQEVSVRVAIRRRPACEQAGIRERLLTPALIRRCAALWQRVRAAAAQGANGERGMAEHELAETRARIVKLVTRIKEDEDAATGEDLAATPAPQIVRLPANYDSLYTRVIAELDEHLASSDGASARQVVRPLIEKIVAQPRGACGGKRRPIHLSLMRSFAEAARE